MKNNCGNTTFQDLLDKRTSFCKDRGWDESDKNTKAILTSLMVELGELAEIYAWKDQYWKPGTDREKKKVMYELIDVFNYLSGLISQIEGVDFCELYFEKMEKLAKKYPVDAGKEVHKRNKQEYRRTGKNELYE